MCRHAFVHSLSSVFSASASPQAEQQQQQCGAAPLWTTFPRSSSSPALHLLDARPERWARDDLLVTVHSRSPSPAASEASVASQLVSGSSCSDCSRFHSLDGGSRPVRSAPPSMPSRSSRDPTGTPRHSERLLSRPSAGRRPVQRAASLPAWPGSSRVISKAKLILAEAVGTDGASTYSDAKMSINTGVLGPLLAMIRSGSDPLKVQDCLDTVRYLAIDDANRSAVVQLDAVGAVLGRLAQDGSNGGTPELLAAGLRTLSALVRDDAARQQLWDGPGAGVVLALLQPRLAPKVLLAALHALDHLAWEAAPAGAAAKGCGHGAAPPRLLAPSIVPALAALLHPSTDAAVLLAALDLLAAAAAAPHTARFPGWGLALFKCVPLLQLGMSSSSCTVAPEAVLATLNLIVVLSDAPELRSTIIAAGCLPLLLSLLLGRDERLALRAACLLSSLADTAVGQERLAEQASLEVMLRVLQGLSGADTKIACLYVLQKLVQRSPIVRAALCAHQAIPTLLRLLQLTSDEDALLGASSLLTLLGWRASASASPSSGSCATMASVKGAAGYVRSLMHDGRHMLV